MRLGNGRWETAKFNSRMQVTELGLGNSAADASVWKTNYAYGEIDSNGDVDAAKNTGNNARQMLSFDGLPQPFVTSYKYDPLYRLTEAKETQNSTQTWKQSFTYDRYGNRIGHQKFFGATQITLDSTTHPAIDTNTNRFNGSQGFTYDKNGNLVTDPTDSGRSFVFNGDNKQKEVRDSNNVLIGEYFYDGEGKLVKKTHIQRRCDKRSYDICLLRWKADRRIFDRSIKKMMVNIRLWGPVLFLFFLLFGMTFRLNLTDLIRNLADQFILGIYNALQKIINFNILNLRGFQYLGYFILLSLIFSSRSTIILSIFI